ncbi:putative quinol monooxygenase [Thalassoglobus sp.]|uniref:putative quinol monooxygenase n=1 Tax=Thalassoglobus sp. TaxID=2795869 RepID=UPI003AA904B4
MFAINVILTVQDETNIDKVQGLLAEAGRLSRQEPGCQTFEVCHSQNDPKIFMLIERWESKETWEVHKTAKAYTEIYHPQVLPLVDREPHFSDILE